MKQNPFELVAVDLTTNRDSTAAQIAKRTGLDIEQVYEALVHMHAQGSARIILQHVAGRPALWAPVPTRVTFELAPSVFLHGESA